MTKLYMAVITAGYLGSVTFKGKVVGRGAVRYFRTIRECRAWAETLGTSADRCDIYKCFGRKGDILKGVHERSAADGKWHRGIVRTSSAFSLST